MLNFLTRGAFISYALPRPGALYNKEPPSL